MDAIRKYIEIGRLLVKRNFVLLSEREQKLLDAWRKHMTPDSNPESRLSYPDFSFLEHRYAKIDAEKEWEMFQRKLSRKHQFKMYLRVVAAGLCLLLGISFLIGLQVKQPSETVASTPIEQGIHLILSNGKRFNLSDRRNIDLKQIEGSVVLHQNRLEYRADSLITDDSVQMNTIQIPRGAFYHLILSDGTKVWLNSESELTYPVAFSKKIREVVLKGEAYFDVTENESCPFVVRTDIFRIKVLGTCFNVNTYGDDGKAYAALEDGVVEITVGQEDVLLLKPGDVAELNVKGPGRLQLSEMSLEEQIAWKEGMFCFRQTPLLDILKQIERYYNIHFVYIDPVEDEIYSGDISRNVSLTELLDAIAAQTTKYQFSVVNDTVYVKKKRD